MCGIKSGCGDADIPPPISYYSDCIGQQIEMKKRRHRGAMTRDENAETVHNRPFPCIGAPILPASTFREESSTPMAKAIGVLFLNG